MRSSHFWNQKMRAPHCFNPQAARTFLQIYLMKTKLVLAGKSKTEIFKTTTSALDRKELPPLEPGAMAYMMSKQQYLGDNDMSWRPHVMFYAASDNAFSTMSAPGSERSTAITAEASSTIPVMLMLSAPVLIHPTAAARRAF